MRRRNQAVLIITGFVLFACILGCAGTRKDDPALLMRVQRVQTALSDITRALESYEADKGYFPRGMATLRDTQYLSIMPDVERDWTLKDYTDGDQVMMVEAVSNPSMPDGAGHKIIYRVPDLSWEGYGITEFP